MADYGRYSSFQCVEVLSETGDELSFEPEFIFEVVCVSQGHSGWFDPRVGGEPDLRPEWEVHDVYIKDASGKQHLVPWEVFESIVGEEMADNMADSAVMDALENYEDIPYDYDDYEPEFDQDHELDGAWDYD